ncbi:MAG: L-threonylcarbamoyladenylate synthase [Acidobacteriota bacterium]
MALHLPHSHTPTLPHFPMSVTLKLDPNNPQPEVIHQAASIIRRGGLVAFPTETVYGLGADALNAEAIKRIFEAKGRPSDNPLIVHVDSGEMLSRVAEGVSEEAQRLIEKFWPGPLTLVLHRRKKVPSIVSAGLATIAARMPENKIALELIRQSNTPIAAPSANLSGRPSPTRAEHVAADLAERVDMILDGGETRIGIESTVLDMTGARPLILRKGWITEEQIAEVIGAVGVAHSEEEMSRSPGTRHRHYSPRARVVLIERASAEEICRKYLEQGTVGFLGHTRLKIDDPRFISIVLKNDAREYARLIYSALREMDEKRVDAIIVEAISEAGEGAAVMDRLRRAASEIV